MPQAHPLQLEAFSVAIKRLDADMPQAHPACVACVSCSCFLSNEPCY